MKFLLIPEAWSLARSVVICASCLYALFHGLEWAGSRVDRWVQAMEQTCYVGTESPVKKPIQRKGGR